MRLAEIIFFALGRAHQHITSADTDVCSYSEHHTASPGSQSVPHGGHCPAAPQESPQNPAQKVRLLLHVLGEDTHLSSQGKAVRTAQLRDFKASPVL